jgi:hypothetical protein
VEEEEFSGEGVGGDVGFAEKMDALFEGGPDVEEFCLGCGHGLIHKIRV